MKKVPAQIWTMLAIIITNAACLLVFVFFIHGYLIYNGMAIWANPDWFGVGIDFIAFLDRFYYINLVFFILLNIFWVCVVPYAIARKNKSSMRGWYWAGFIINAVAGICGAPFLVWLPYGLDVVTFLVLLGLSLLASVGVFIISSLCVDQNIRGWWRF